MGRLKRVVSRWLAAAPRLLLRALLVVPLLAAYLVGLAARLFDYVEAAIIEGWLIGSGR